MAKTIRPVPAIRASKWGLEHIIAKATGRLATYARGCHFHASAGPKAILPSRLFVRIELTLWSYTKSTTWLSSSRNLDT